MHQANPQPLTSTTRPSVSVIISAYNGRSYLPACLASLYNELEPQDEVIIVDDNSNDGTIDYIRTNFPQSHLICNKLNQGFAAACNRGAAHAQGDILVFLNQDTRVEIGWLRGLVDALQDEEVGMATSQVRMMSSPDRLHLAGQAVHYTGLVFGRGHLDPADNWDEPADVAAVSGASFAIRRGLWEALGGFDDTFYMYYEETDLSWRTWLAGYRCRYIPGSRTCHDFQPGRPGWNRLYYSSRNRLLLLLKNLRLPTLFLLSPALLLAELIDWMIATRNGTIGLRAKLQGTLWILTHPVQITQTRNRARQKHAGQETLLLRELSYHVHPYPMSGGFSNRIVNMVNVIFSIIYHPVLGLYKRVGW